METIAQKKGDDSFEDVEWNIRLLYTQLLVLK